MHRQFPDGEPSGMTELHPMLTVGLTGGIASGKSTVDAMFEALGARVIDADEIVHSLLAPGGTAAPSIIEAFGPALAAPGGGVDRAALGALVFTDAQARARLERIVHPLVTEEIGRRIIEHARRPDPPIVIIDAALLVETGADSQFDRLVVITCREETQVARLVSSRGLSPEEALRKVRAQASSEEKAARADYRIVNDGGLEQTLAQVRAVYEALLEDQRRTKETWSRRTNN